ncbi:MAG: GNAT family N-acetyltransferase [Lewinellaceae bacterium]|nr:GNAT family N-acetyltransferase [Lewinellaceae bacterium]
MGIILKETDELVGTVGFIISKHCKQGTIEIAIAIKPAYWKNGIGKEASITLINAVFENNFAETIVGRRHIDNHASQKCTHSLGLEEIGKLKEDLRTAVMFRLTKATWIKKHGFFYTTHHSTI